MSFKPIIKRLRDGFNDDADPLSHLPYDLSDRVRRKLPPDIINLVETAEVCAEAHNLTRQTFAEIANYFNEHRAFRPYWTHFTSQYQEGEEIPPHRLKAFVCWFAAKQGASLRSKGHMRLVANNGPVVSKYFPQESKPEKRVRKRLKSKT